MIVRFGYWLAFAVWNWTIVPDELARWFVRHVCGLEVGFAGPE